MNREVLVKAVPLMVVSGLGLVFGLLREVSIAYGFGATWSSDTYFVAILPVLIVGALGTDIGVTMVPLYVRRQTEQGQQDASLVFRRISLQVSLGAAVLIGATAAAASLWVPLVAPGMPEASRHEAILLCWILAPGTALILPAMLWQAQASAHHRFSMPQMATYAPNLGIILAAVLLAGSVGVVGLAIGQTTGFLLQAALLWAAARGSEPEARSVSTAGDDEHPIEMRAFLVTWGLVILGTLMSKFEPLLQRYYASALGAGEISSLNYAQRISFLPNVLFTTAVATVAFPRLSRLVLTDPGAFKRLLRVLILVSVIALGAIAVLLFFTRAWVVSLLLGYGRFTGQDVVRTASVLGCFCLTIVPIGLAIVLLRSVLVLQKASYYAIGGIVSLAVWWWVAQALVPTLGSGGLGVASAAGYLALDAALVLGLWVGLRKQQVGSVVPTVESTEPVQLGGPSA